MTQETYRFAYDEACAELREILGQFNQLRARKEQVEQVIEALRPLLVEMQTAESNPDQAVAEPAPFLVQQTPDLSPEPTPEVSQETFPEPAYASAEAYAAEPSSDPFQRRIDNALRHGLGSRESKIFPRTLNGLLSRA
jgi:hypothetical protein